jgi:hypothetical protein
MSKFPKKSLENLVPEGAELIDESGIVVDAEVTCDAIYKLNGKIIEASSEWNFEKQEWGDIEREEL